MTTTVYKSTDTSAPTLSGTVGDLITLLNKCLVDGYGSKSAAGWTKPFTSTNAADYLQGTGSNGYSLQVDDNGPGAGGAKEARIRGYETMSAYNTGTNLFPTAAQQTNGGFVRKSTTADATTRPWIVVADSRTVYGFVLTGDVANAYMAFGFGEFYSRKSTTDTGRCFIRGRLAENSGIAGNEGFDLCGVLGTNQTQFYIARDHQNNVGAVQCSQVGEQSFNASPANGTALKGDIAQTNLIDSAACIARIWVCNTTGGNNRRGWLRGLWHWGHPVAGVSDGDTFSGSGDTAGRTFMIIKGTPNSGVFCVETSSTWDSN